MWGPLADTGLRLFWSCAGPYHVRLDTSLLCYPVVSQGYVYTGDSLRGGTAKSFGIHPFVLLSNPGIVPCGLNGGGSRDLSGPSLSHNELATRSVVNREYTDRVLCLIVSRLKLGLRIRLHPRLTSCANHQASLILLWLKRQLPLGNFPPFGRDCVVGISPLSNRQEIPDSLSFVFRFRELRVSR